MSLLKKIFILSLCSLLGGMVWAYTQNLWFEQVLAQEPQTEQKTDLSGVLQGVVQTEDGEPLPDVLIKVQATNIHTSTAEDGSFSLSNLAMTKAITVTAWRKNYYFGWVYATPQPAELALQNTHVITLRRYERIDHHAEYEWQPAEDCGECHTAYNEWRQDAHALTAVNPYFLNMYQGTDIHGNQSPPSGYEAGNPQLPDLSQPYFGPGFKVDLPTRDGNCATCHVPQAAQLSTTDSCAWSGCHSDLVSSVSEEIAEGVNPMNLTGLAAEGISCDFCHKIARVALDDETGLPDPAKSGILSLGMYRPAGDHQLFFGSADDVAREDDSFLLLQKKSEFCAACHVGVFHGVSIYNSYGEWLDSPYSSAETGQTCQDCHMPASGFDHFVFPEKGGVIRPVAQTHNHLMPGSRDDDLLQNALSLSTTIVAQGDDLRLEVSVHNDKTGHHVPTGSPLRHVMLVVQVLDDEGHPLPLLDGPQLPAWAGEYAQEPGRGYAKILADLVTGEQPSYAFWKETELISDTRLPALSTDISTYTFAMPTESQYVSVSTKLIYRRAFRELMDWKDWQEPDRIMEKNFILIGNLCRQGPCIL